MIKKRWMLYFSWLFIIALSILPLFFSISEDELEKDVKSVELFDTSIKGYNNGSLVWIMAVDHAWTTQSKYFFYADHVSSGVILNSLNEVVLDSIQANTVKINSKSKTVTVSEGIQARLITYNTKDKNGLIANESSSMPIIITADKLNYFSERDTTYLDDNVVLQRHDAEIRPFKGVAIDNKKNTASISNGFNIRSDEFSVTGNRLVIDIDESKSTLHGGLIFEKFPLSDTKTKLNDQEVTLRKKQTFLYADEATYLDATDTKILNVSGNIKVDQPDKYLESNAASYEQNTSNFTMRGQVQITLEGLDWIFADNTIDKIKNDTIQTSLNQPTSVFAKALFFDGDKQQTRLTGNVKILQEDQVIYADTVLVHNKTQTVECIGDVEFTKANKNVLKTNYLLIDLKTQTFTADQGVYSEFYLDSKN